MKSLLSNGEPLNGMTKNGFETTWRPSCYFKMLNQARMMPVLTEGKRMGRTIGPITTEDLKICFMDKMAQEADDGVP